MEDRLSEYDDMFQRARYFIAMYFRLCTRTRGFKCDVIPERFAALYFKTSRLETVFRNVESISLFLEYLVSQHSEDPRVSQISPVFCTATLIIRLLSPLTPTHASSFFYYGPYNTVISWHCQRCKSLKEDDKRFLERSQCDVPPLVSMWTTSSRSSLKISHEPDTKVNAEKERDGAAGTLRTGLIGQCAD